MGPQEATEYDLFISYSTRSDYRLARRLESFLESFHRTRAGKGAQLSQLDACLDGSDFVIPATESAQQSVPEVIERHLLRCRHLLVLCSAASMRSKWVREEIRLFREAHGAGGIVLALTEGTDAENDPSAFFAPEVVDAGLHEAIWYDLRGFRRKQRRLATVRDFDSERLRLLAHLHGRAASEIEPLWARDRQRTARRRALMGACAAVALIGLVSAYYVQLRVADEEKLRAKVASVMEQVALAYRDRYTDPFTAVASAYESTLEEVPDETAAEREVALATVHRVLVERQRISREQRTVVAPRGFSFASQARSDERFTKLSPDAEHVLVLTDVKGNATPEMKTDRPGRAYVLNNRTLKAHELVSAKDPMGYPLAFADFAGEGMVIVGRWIYVEFFDADSGDLLNSLQLGSTKSPITAAGVLNEQVFIAGNGAGCVWIDERGVRGYPRPSEVFSVDPSKCDASVEQHADAVVQILANPTTQLALILHESGRVDLLEPMETRHAVLESGGQAAVHHPGGSRSFAVASTQADEIQLVRWDLLDGKLRRSGGFRVPASTGPIDLLGCPADGAYLIGLDRESTLHIWNYEDRELLMSRPWRE